MHKRPHNPVLLCVFHSKDKNRKKRLAVALCALGVIPFLTMKNVEASPSSKKPPKPVLTKISSVSRGVKGKVDVTVIFKLEKSSSVQPIQMTDVKIGNTLCRAMKASLRCTAQKISVGKNMKVIARSRNKAGFGVWSTAVWFNVRAGSVWRRTTQSTSTTVAASTTSVVTLPNRVTPASLKFNFTSAAVLAVMDSTVTSKRVQSLASDSNLKAVRQDGSVFDAVENGTISVRKIMTAPADKLYILLNIPTTIDGANCILLQVQRQTGEAVCVEREWDFIRKHYPSDLFPDRVEREFQFDSSGAIYYSGTPKRHLIGTTGYFEGWSEFPSPQEDSPENLVVRRWKDGELTDFGYGALPGKAANQPDYVDVTNFEFNEPAPGTRRVTGLQATRSRYIKHWIATPEGFLLTEQFMGYLNQKLPWTGETVNAGHKLIVYSPTGESQEIRNTERSCSYVVNGTWCNNMSLMTSYLPGKIAINCPYYDATPDIPGGICQIDTSTWQLGQREVGQWATNCGTNEFQNQIRPKFERWHTYVCFHGASKWHRSWRTPSGEFYALVGGSSICLYSDGQNCSSTWGTQLWFDRNYTGIIVQVSPQFRATRLGGVPGDNLLENIEVAEPILNSVVTSGPATLSANGRDPSDFKTIITNLDTGESQDLLPVSLNIRVKTLTYSSSNNSIFFSGIKTDSGQITSGVIDLATGRITDIVGLGGTATSLLSLSSAK